MYLAFNMGIGFCVVVREDEAGQAIAILEREGTLGRRIGTVVADPQKRIQLPRQGLVGAEGQFPPAKL
jgi:phosphoribosylaminoimidazole (AIR) synthetase